MREPVLPRLLRFLACLLLGIVVLVPFAMILMNSLKTSRESALFKLTFPAQLVWKNYVTVLSKPAIIRGFINTIVIAAATVAFTTVTASMAAFVIQRRPGKVTRSLYYLFLLGLVIPVSIIPTIRLLMGMGIHNTYGGIVLYYIAVNLPFSVFLFTGFMGSVPREMDEAAMLEGCGRLTLFFRVILPLLSNVFVTSTIIVAIAVWDDFIGPFYLISDYRKWTIVLNIYSFVSQYETNWGVVFAFLMLVMIPVLGLYFTLQRYIISGVTAGSLKG